MKPTEANVVSKKPEHFPSRLMSVIGDEDTCVGFILSGIAETNKERETNVLVVDDDTDPATVEECFKRFIKRQDIAIILINQHVADMIRSTVDAHCKPVPAVLEIPSKKSPYNPEKDSILKRARRLVSPDETG
ncbi:V-type proton ATPase subunit F [Tribolium castaneum]|uniref:V-type proton ATPase subunit F n=1 Tax=Tribolium castaneum TaxID=7070 RepID=D2A068_TRICA|nr:PREDICTED: V-type proton ATPase subunit F [Tribolium castaneum]EFA02476.1 V-type proton ATPase subunit F 1-like Protein [Tribolium castaneum]|eukprot:XP_008192245.1 PREDICTED: V-type proton ATPase subunit F [Tribolium castaneum]